MIEKVREKFGIAKLSIDIIWPITSLRSIADRTAISSRKRDRSCGVRLPRHQASLIATSALFSIAIFGDNFALQIFLENARLSQ